MSTGTTKIVNLNESSKFKHYLGPFANEAALIAAHPSGELGDYALIQTTDSFWIWNVAGANWVNGDKTGAEAPANYRDFENLAADPANPAADKLRQYVKDGQVSLIDENGGIILLPTKTELRNAVSEALSYWFGGSNSGIELLQPISFADGEKWTYLFWGKLISNDLNYCFVSGDAQNYGIVLRESNENRYKFRSTDSSYSSNYITHNDFDKLGLTAFVCNGDGTIDVYFNAENRGALICPSGTSVSISGLGANINYEVQGEVKGWGIFNKALSASDIASISLNPEDIPHEHEGASNIPKFEDDFSTDKGWIGTDIPYSVANQRLEGIGDGGSLISYVQTSENLSANKLFLYSAEITADNAASVDLKTGDLLRDSTGTACSLLISGENYNYVSDGSMKKVILILKSINTVRYIRQFLQISTNGANYYIDNFSLTQIGEVAAFHPSGIGHNGWKGKYGAFAQINGVIPFNLPANHAEADIINTTSTSPSVTPPKGYVVESISIKTKANLTAIVAQQAGSLDDLVTGKVLDGSGAEKSKTYRQIGDHEIFDGATTLNFTLTGNDANGTIITLTYKREE